MESILTQHDAGDKGVPELRFALEKLKETADILQQKGIEGEVSVKNRPGSSWILPDMVLYMRNHLYQALDTPGIWTGLRHSGSSEADLKTRIRQVPFLDLDTKAKEILSTGFRSSLDSLRQGIDANLRLLGIDMTLEYIHWSVDEVIPELYHYPYFVGETLRKNEAHQIAWQPCTLTEQDLLGTENCGVSLFRS